MNRISVAARRITMVASSALAVAAAVTAGGCGPSVPQHNGYPIGMRAPWKHPRKLTLDDNEAEIDDHVSYPDRQRARWYALELPADGALTIHLAVTTFGAAKRQIDLAFEVLDADGRKIVRADANSDDAGLQDKTRKLPHVRAGRYLIEVYAQNRLDRADYTLRVKYSRGEKVAAADFPASVKFVGNLPAVPPFDDAPPPRAHHEHEHHHHHEQAKPQAKKTLVGRIAGISATSRGTRIRIDRGRAAGVAVGWTGVVTNKAGRGIPQGSFHITKVTDRESFGTVRASSDAVLSARYVRLQSP